MAANSQKNKFLIDGFPRNEDNLQGWNKTMDGKADVSFVLFFDCDNEIMMVWEGRKMYGVDKISLSFVLA